MRRKDHRPLHGHVAVVTGACCGVGLATAYALAKRGARVVLAGSCEALLADAAAEIDASGGDAAHVVADVSKVEDARRVAARALALYERIDVWVNAPEPDTGPRVDGFDRRFWAVANGSFVGLGSVRATGGAIVNVAVSQAERTFTLGLCRDVERAESTGVRVALVNAVGVDAADAARKILAAAMESPAPSDAHPVAA